jgi:hypothetical protein
VVRPGANEVELMEHLVFLGVWGAVLTSLLQLCTCRHRNHPTKLSSCCALSSPSFINALILHLLSQSRDAEVKVQLIHVALDSPAGAQFTHAQPIASIRVKLLSETAKLARRRPSVDRSSI